jgi:hypothetical protein
MSESGTRAAIAAKIASLPDIGIVHDYERWAADSAKFIEFFTATIGGVSQIRGWEISRKKAVEDTTSTRGHIYLIKGYMGLKDAAATEKTFNGLIEEIALAFRRSQSLGGATLGHDFIQVQTIEARMFGSVLCHCAELSITCYDDKYHEEEDYGL